MYVAIPLWVLQILYWGVGFYRGYVGVSIGAISALGRLPSIVENPCFF